MSARKDHEATIDALIATDANLIEADRILSKRIDLLVERVGFLNEVVDRLLDPRKVAR